MRYNSNMYSVMINTTLDCNLNCWYCYENRIPDSKLRPEVEEAIKKHIEREYNIARFNTLEMSFFGGEPFLYFEGIKRMLDYAKEFCDARKIELIADFTTNATLITEAHVNYLKAFKTNFQITLDGDRSIHNGVKIDKTNLSLDIYQKTIDALRLINIQIPHRWIAVRVNFDTRTLQKIDEIIADINFLDRRSTYVILKRIWQISDETIDKALLYEAIQKLFNKKFLVDYYIKPKGNICFADRNRHVLFNYDGGVFKCSTISSFTEKEALGKLDFTTGQVSWDSNKMAFWLKNIIQKKCEECKWFPACLGPCNKQILAHKNEICGFDSINMNTKEYLMYSFKFHLLKAELNSTKA